MSVVDLFQTYIQQEIVPQEADSDIKRDVILRELRNSGGIETVELMENYSSVERTSSSLKKSVQKKTKLNYEGDSVVTVSHVKLDDEMFFNNGASTHQTTIVSCSQNKLPKTLRAKMWYPQQSEWHVMVIYLAMRKLS